MVRNGLAAKRGSDNAPADQRRADAGHEGDPVVVGKVHRIQERDAHAVVVEAAEVEIGEIGIAAAASAEDPGAGRQRFELVAPDLAHQDGAADRSSFALPKASPSPDGILAICEARRNFSSPTVR